MSHWVYHPKETAKIVSSTEYQYHLNNGWCDAPDKCEKKEIELGGIVPHRTFENEENVTNIRRRGRPPKQLTV